MDAIMMKKMFARWADIMVQNKENLISLDSVAGDGDLGLTMSDGFLAVSEAANSSEETDLGKLLYQAGKTLSKAAPSSMGTLISMGLMNAGKTLKGRTELDNDGIAAMLQAVGDSIMEVGKAKEGEKTFLDAILPAARAAKENVSKERSVMTAAAAKAAEDGFNRATAMVARHGRIAFRGNDSVGIKDPGAAVAMFLVKGLNDLYNM